MTKAARGRPSGKFTQHRRVDRVRELLERHPRGLTLYELADALQVTVRTLRRYLPEIARDYQLESTSTRGGGALIWKIRSGEVARKVELRRTQAYALLAARRLFEPMRGSTLFEEIDLAVNKLLAFAQRPGRGPNAGLADARLEDRFLYLPHAPKNYAEKTQELDDLFQAVSDLRPLTLSYRSATKAAEERITIHPYALVLHRDSIYSVGYHVARGEVRTFVLDRMRDTECAATERFELPPDFNVEEYFQGEFGIWKSPTPKKVVIDFDAAVPSTSECAGFTHRRSSRVCLAGACASRSPSATCSRSRAGCSSGASARVIEPPELVEAVRAELEGALERYQSPTPAKARKAKS